MLEQAGNPAGISPFRVQVPEHTIADLRRRIDATRLPVPSPGEPWSDGPPELFVRGLLSYWRDGFDWPRQERLINDMAQYYAPALGDGLHFVHVRSTEPEALPLLLTHGWPGSFWEFHRIIPMLTDPAAHGGKPADAFHVVAPSLPGYGWSAPPTRPGRGPASIAAIFAELMTMLGYQRYGAQGGDWGARISAELAVAAPEQVAGVHLNFPGFIAPPPDLDLAALADDERASLLQGRAFAAAGAAYLQLQSTRPQTAAYGLADSPAGLAAWIAEKYWEWVDHDGDLDAVISRDDLLTIITIYWATNTIGSSMQLYRQHERRPWGTRVPVPVGCAVFPRETLPPVRSWVEKFLDVRQWTDMPRGGHFAALEQPDLLVADIRRFFAPLRAGHERRI